MRDEGRGLHERCSATLEAARLGRARHRRCRGLRGLGCARRLQEQSDHLQGRFIGRFNIETFIVAPGTAPAPFVHDNAFPDAISNPATGPVHTFHLGLWFNSPDDAVQAGCPGAVTPFNGEHNAGSQVLSTRNAPDDMGPLRSLEP
jgi:hypothetical protein